MGSTKTNTFSIGTAAELIVPADEKRTSLIISNLHSTLLVVSSEPTVTLTTGHPLTPLEAAAAGVNAKRDTLELSKKIHGAAARAAWFGLHETSAGPVAVTQSWGD